MAFNEQLAIRVRTQLHRQVGLSEKKIFGGLAFLINGNMSVGIHGDELIVRIAPESTDAALKELGTRLFNMTGRPMKGWLLVGGAGTKVPHRLQSGFTAALTMPRRFRRSEIM